MDREKVIKGLEHCRLMCEGVSHNPCNGCPYQGYQGCFDCADKLKTDALELLKEQEAKTGHWVSVNDGDIVAIDNDGFPEKACFCSECKKYLIASDEYAVYGRYCPFCGAKMEGGEVGCLTGRRLFMS